MTAKKTVRLFLSHSAEDRDLSRSLARAIEAEDPDFACWLADDHIRPGDSIVDNIAEAIDACDAAILILSHQAQVSKWVQYELEQLRELEHTPLIIVRTGDSDLPSDLPSLLVIDLGDDLVPAAQIITKQLSDLKKEAEPYRPFRSTTPLPSRSRISVGRERELDLLLSALNDDSKRTIMIMGPGGSGKSWLINEGLSRLDKPSSFEQILFIPVGRYQNAEALLSDIARSIQTDEGYSKAFFASLYRNDLRASIDALLAIFAKHRVLLVIDGIDELRDGQKSIEPLIVGFPLNKGRSKLVVTARSVSIADWPEAIHTTFMIRLSELSGSDSERLLFQIAKEHGMPDEEAHNFFQQARAKGIIPGTPLLLSLAVQSWLHQNTIPDSIEATVKHAFDSLSEPARNVLEALAHLHGPSTERTIRTLIPREQWQYLDATLEKLFKTGFLAREEDGRLYFVHRSLVEYLETCLGHENGDGDDGVLYITVDPSLIAKEDFVELLDVLNSIYSDLGGDELLIRQDEVGHFASAGVLV